MSYGAYSAFAFCGGKSRAHRVPEFEDAALFPNYDYSMCEGSSKDFASAYDSYHAVLGRGNLQVGCYKQCLPEIYVWNEKAMSPKKFNVARELNLNDNDIDDGNYDVEFELRGAQLHFVGRACSITGHCEAALTETDGTEWFAVYDACYGDKFTDSGNVYPLATVQKGRLPRKWKKYIQRGCYYYTTWAEVLALQQERSMYAHDKLFTPEECAKAKYYFARHLDLQAKYDKRRLKRYYQKLVNNGLEFFNRR